MIRECLGNKGIEKVFRFDAITCDKIQIWSINFLHVVPPETIVRQQNYSGLCHRWPKFITWTRTWLLLASGVVLQTVIYKGLYGIDRFFLKEIKNVMFLNKIDVPYCLVVFFVVCPRLRPFWSVFGELALFWCPTAKRKTRQNSDSRSVRRSRRIIPLENYPRSQFLQKFKAEMSFF